MTRTSGRPSVFAIDPGWAVLLRDIDVPSANVLRRAGLPGDILGRRGGVLTASGFFVLWRALEEEAADPMLALREG